MQNTKTYEREGVDQDTVNAVRTVGERYKYGFETEIEMEYAPKGVNADIVRLISKKNDSRFCEMNRFILCQSSASRIQFKHPELDEPLFEKKLSFAIIKRLV